MQYKNTDEKIFLSKKTSLDNRWLLPEKTATNTDFYIKVEDETFSGNALAYNLVSSDNTAIKVGGSNLPNEMHLDEMLQQMRNNFVWEVTL
ncbi:hypothetical protein AB1278_00175 [Chryseobacterium sp. NRRL B-14798]|uniref:hypothetical protein n=1 Tax=Chryseobacterium sp. NRRL B-14798 TaxID=3162880 RepID=UPI003D23B81B